MITNVGRSLIPVPKTEIFKQLVCILGSNRWEILSGLIVVSVCEAIHDVDVEIQKVKQ